MPLNSAKISDTEGVQSLLYEVTQEAHYYPFGMRIEAPDGFVPTLANAIPYLYNGIEHIGDLGLDVNTAFYRTLDPALGRWWQIDPKSEAFYAHNPYNSMGNNPIIAVDPNGDLAFTGIEAALQVGSAIAGPVLNAIGGKYNGKPLQFVGDLALNLANAVVNAAIAEVNPLDFNAGFASGGISVRTQIGTDGIGIGVEAGVSAGYGNHRFVEAYAGINFYSSAIGTNRPTIEGYVGVGVGYKYLTGSGDVLCPWDKKKGYADEVFAGAMLRSTLFFSGETSQRVGGFAALFPSFGKQGSLSYNNDWFFGSPNGDGGDRYRTTGANVKVGDFEAGINLFTGDPGLNSADRRVDGENGTYQGVYREAIPYRAGIFYLGYKGQRIGLNSESVRVTFQNKLAHKGGYLFPKFKNMGGSPSLFLQHSKNSRYTLW